MSAYATSYNDDILRSRLVVRRRISEDEPRKRIYDRDFRRPTVRPVRVESPYQSTALVQQSQPADAEDDDSPLAYVNLGFSKDERGPSRTTPQIFGIQKMRKQRLTFAMALLVFIVGISVSLQGFLANKHVTEQTAQAASSSLSQTSETPVSPDQLKTYQVSPDMPRYVRVPSQGIEARILQVGTGADGAVETPTNVNDAGWYRGSSLPGQTGAGLIVGHVSGISQPGVFKTIGNLSPGDVIEIELGNGTVLKYSVRETAVYNKDDVDMPRALSVVGNAGSGLNLITCHGTFDSATQQYSERLVVFATLIK